MSINKKKNIKYKNELFKIFLETKNIYNLVDCDYSDYRCKLYRLYKKIEEQFFIDNAITLYKNFLFYNFFTSALEVNKKIKAHFSYYWILEIQEDIKAHVTWNSKVFYSDYLKNIHDVKTHKNHNHIDYLNIDKITFLRSECVKLFYEGYFFENEFIKYKVLKNIFIHKFGLNFLYFMNKDIYNIIIKQFVAIKNKRSQHTLIKLLINEKNFYTLYHLKNAGLNFNQKIDNKFIYEYFFETSNGLCYLLADNTNDIAINYLFEDCCSILQKHIYTIIKSPALKEHFLRKFKLLTKTEQFYLLYNTNDNDKYIFDYLLDNDYLLNNIDFITDLGFDFTLIKMEKLDEWENKIKIIKNKYGFYLNKIEIIEKNIIIIKLYKQMNEIL